MRQIFLFLPIAVGLAFYSRNLRFLVSIILLSILSFWPLFWTDRYLRLDPDACSKASCQTVIFANLRDQLEAVRKLGVIAEKQNADLITMSEFPHNLTKKQLRQIIPGYPFIIRHAESKDGRRLGSLKVVLSKRKIIDRELFVENGEMYPRSILQFTVGEGQPGEYEFYLTHPRIPLARAGARRRDEVLSNLKKMTKKQKRYLIAGDFNLTPWTPMFRSLPGKRAGDPRFISTWKVGRELLGFPIDHFMVSERIYVAESKVLNPIGSDHRPILIRFAVGDD